MTTCLLMACSKAKRQMPGNLPALERYDGPPYRVVRKLRRARGLPADLHILIVSARYGLLRSDELVDLYDQRMSLELAESIRGEASSRLDEWLAQIRPRGMFVNLGKAYVQAISSSVEYERLRLAGVVRVADGPPGVRLAQLGAWLRSGGKG